MFGFKFINEEKLNDLRRENESLKKGIHELEGLLSERDKKISDMKVEIDKLQFSLLCNKQDKEEILAKVKDAKESVCENSEKKTTKKRRVTKKKVE